MSSQYREVPEAGDQPEDISRRTSTQLNSPRRPIWQKVMIALAVVALVLVLAAVAVFYGVKRSINSSITHIDLPQSAPLAEAKKGAPIDFLIMGSDSRQSGGDPTNWQMGAGRSDVTMLAQISGDRKSVSIMSIPRDSWVPIPGHGEAKINAAYSWGGPSLAIETVEQLTGIPINHFMVVDFTSFSELTDSLGGVDINTTAGVQHLHGDQALTFVRERFDLPRGDFDRVQRQQAWMRAIMEKAQSGGFLTNPAELSELAGIITRYSAVDQTLNADTLIDLGLSFGSSGDKPTVNFITAPFTGTGTSEDGQSIVLLDNEKLKLVAQAFRDDRVSEYIVSDPELDRVTDQPVV